ncbi:hypothetical protein [Bradyrhizobium sp. CCBAU 53415]|uniref:hypothetical protein n=1 Tax=Bradyrhizobium sp. CCBAU 53415 TaxID=1325119 RepID=UPI0023061C3C|nr:hypothetical protein [Bradyrhizobium sp. CCBAU 53415]
MDTQSSLKLLAALFAVWRKGLLSSTEISAILRGRGLAKNLWLMAKTVGRRRALSRPDLFAYGESMIRQPPAPVELLRAMQDWHVRWEGVQISLVEYYRRHYLTPALP